MDIVYIVQFHADTHYIDCDTFLSDAVATVHLPDQDMDHDGMPDVGQPPVISLNMQLIGKRLDTSVPF